MNALKKYLSKRLNRLTNQLKGYHHLHGHDALHQIRIEIKKLKTIIQLIHFSYPQFKARACFTPLRSIFRRAGEIREPELLYRLLLTYEIDGVGDKYIPKASEASQLSIAFQKDVPRFLMIVKSQQKRLTTNCRRVSKDSYKSYIKNLRTELRPLLFPKLRKKMLHKARKLVKEILYLNQVRSNSKKCLFFNQAEKTIGQWHDKQSLLELLKKVKDLEKIELLEARSKEDELELKKEASRYYETHKK